MSMRRSATASKDKKRSWATSRSSGSWIKVYNFQGFPFYRHSHTGETQWEIPENDISKGSTWTIRFNDVGNGQTEVRYFNKTTHEYILPLSPLALQDQDPHFRGPAYMLDLKDSADEIVAAPMVWHHSSSRNIDETDDDSSNSDSNTPENSEENASMSTTHQISLFMNKSVSKMEQSFGSFVQMARRWGHTIKEATKSYETAVRVSTALGPGLAFKPRANHRSQDQKVNPKWTVYLEDGQRVELPFADLKFGAGVEISGRRKVAETPYSDPEASQVAAALEAAASASMTNSLTKNAIDHMTKTNQNSEESHSSPFLNRNGVVSRVRVRTPFGEGLIVRQHPGGLYDVLINDKGTVSIPKSQLIFGGGEQFDPSKVPQSKAGRTRVLEKIVSSLDAVLDPIVQRAMKKEASGDGDGRDDQEQDEDGNDSGLWKSKPEIPELDLRRVQPSITLSHPAMPQNARK